MAKSTIKPSTIISEGVLDVSEKMKAVSSDMNAEIKAEDGTILEWDVEYDD